MCENLSRLVCYIDALGFINFCVKIPETLSFYNISLHLTVHFITRQQTKDMKPQVQKLLSLWLESIQRNHPGKHITFLLDVSKSSLANVDVGGIRFMLDCFTTYFPDMLG